MSRLYRGIVVAIVCALVVGAFASGYFFGQKVVVVSTKTVTEYFPTASPFMTVLRIRVVDDRNLTQGIANATLAIFFNHIIVETGRTNPDGYFTTYNRYNVESELTALVSSENYHTIWTLLPIRATPIQIEMSHVAGFPNRASNGTERITITMIVCNPLIESTWHNCWPKMYPAIPPYIQP